MKHGTHIVKAHQRSFDTAPRTRVRDVVQPIRHDVDNPGWFYGMTPDGVEGYFPSEWFDIAADGSEAIAQREYDAMELTVAVGEQVECLDAVAGWILVQTADGRHGWVPQECIS